MRRIRKWLACHLFDLAAYIHPTPLVRSLSEAHHIGNLWFTWKLERSDPVSVQTKVVDLDGRIVRY